MIERFNKYINLGDPIFFWNLFELLKNKKHWTTNEIDQYFYNKKINGKDIFDGWLSLLKLSNVINVDKNEIIEINPIYKNIFLNFELFKKQLLKIFLLTFMNDSDFYKIFTSKENSYDFIHKTIIISFNSFKLKHSAIKNLLIDFGFLIRHPDFPFQNLLINLEWKDFFEKEFNFKSQKQKINIEELKNKLEIQQLNGEIAEKFVLKYENLRLKEKSGIQWIAPFDVAAGFDILSFDSESSIDNDRYIEVKSYSGPKSYFYWSKNEIETARLRKNKYYIYLINRDNLKNDNYEPKIINNPIKNILNNEENWIKKVEKYYLIEKH